MLGRLLPAVLAIATTTTVYAMEDEVPDHRRHHLVVDGENLAVIAWRVYGSSAMAQVIRDANPDVDLDELEPGQSLVIPEITVADPTIDEISDTMGDPPQPEDQLSDQRRRHDDLVQDHPQLDGGGIAEQWKTALAAAEDAQRAVSSAADETDRVKTAELYATLLDHQLDLQQVLDRMEIEAAVLDTFATLRDDPASDPDGAKAKRAGALRAELLAALAKQHALQRDALALRHHAAHVDAEADGKDAEAETAATALQAVRSQLEALTGRGESSQPEGMEPATTPAPGDRLGF